jgi:hypothetical protein
LHFPNFSDFPALFDLMRDLELTTCFLFQLKMLLQVIFCLQVVLKTGQRVSGSGTYSLVMERRLENNHVPDAVTPTWQTGKDYLKL